MTVINLVKELRDTAEKTMGSGHTMRSVRALHDRVLPSAHIYSLDPCSHIGLHLVGICSGTRYRRHFGNRV